VTPISVIVPSLNQGRFIRQALESLCSQNYPGLEIIVVDGGSSDETLAILNEYSDKISWKSEPDKGQTDAIAKGFSKASSEWLAWLNADDIQTNNALWKVHETIEKEPNCSVLVGHGHYIDMAGNFLRPYPRIKVEPSVDVVRELFLKGYVAQPSVFFRKSAYFGVGGMRGELNFCMDYDLWCRLAVAGYKFGKIDFDISANRWYESTKTAAQLLDLLAEVAAVQIKIFGKVSPYFVQAISDNLYAKFYARLYGDAHHLIWRFLFFKVFCFFLNHRNPAHCLRGLLTESIAKSGPIQNDTLTVGDVLKYLKNKLFRGFR
jgi:glycosyltransferase involved in cell wall biosynthesis